MRVERQRNREKEIADRGREMWGKRERERERVMPKGCFFLVSDGGLVCILFPLQGRRSSGLAFPHKHKMNLSYSIQTSASQQIDFS